jgi:hypothetical protein
LSCTRTFTAMFGVLLALGFSAATPARADTPTPEERTRIETSLRAMGFERWGDIERESQGREWEVDDAIMPDGRQFSLRLAADDLREVSRALEGPSHDERAKIAAKLNSLGFTGWKEIEPEAQGSEWAVEDARAADGEEFDVRLAADDLRELSRQAD